MQLTERQRWNVIRDLVKEKNEEYSNLLCSFFDRNQLKLLLGHTREVFLSNFGIYSMNEFDNRIKEQGKVPVQNWLDNLSSEDLLIFLDFRCKILQSLYKHYKMYRSVKAKDVELIIDNTKVAKVKFFNLRQLVGTGKPKKVEQDAEKIELNEDVRETAIHLTMQNIASMYCANKEVLPSEAIEKTSRLTTHNVNASGSITGYKYKGTNPLIVTPKPKEKVVKQGRKFHMIGYDIDFNPIFICEGKTVNLFREPVAKEKIIYDSERNLLVRHDEREEDEFNTNAYKCVGMDVQGTPVYLDEEGYVTSTGRRLDDDEFIYSNEDVDRLDF